MTNYDTTRQQFVGYTEITREEYMAEIEALFSHEDAQYIFDAYQMAKYGHGYKNQKRDNGRRYFDHPREVSLIYFREFGGRRKEGIAGALLHDIDEDTFLFTTSSLERMFGNEFATNNRLLTKRPQKGYLDRMLQYGNVTVWLIKLADMLHNTRTLVDCPVAKRIRKIAEMKTNVSRLLDAVVSALSDEGISLVKKIESLFNDAFAFVEASIPQE